MCSQTWADDHPWITTTFLQRPNLSWRPPLDNDHLSTPTTILAFLFPHLECNGTSEQRSPVNNCHNFGVLRVVVVLRSDCIWYFIGYKCICNILKIRWVLRQVSYEINIRHLILLRGFQLKFKHFHVVLYFLSILLKALTLLLSWNRSCFY